MIPFLHWIYIDEFIGAPFDRIMADIGPLITTLELELNALAWTLERYDDEGGGRALFEFYHMRYIAIIVWLKALNHLLGHTKVDKIFKPEQYKGIFEPDGRPHK